MKKIMIFIVALLCLVLPLNAKAINLEEYNVTNLEQALAEEEIEKKFDKYTETDKQVTIYLFRGNGCPHCTDFLEYLNKIYDKEGEKFRVVSFESWKDAKNAALQVEVAKFLNLDNPEKPGVPLIIIGEEKFEGFAEAVSGTAVLNAINKVYEQDKDERYDIFEEMEKAEEEKPSTGAGAGAVAIIVFCAAAVVIIYDTIRFNKLQDSINRISSKKNN